MELHTVHIPIFNKKKKINLSMLDQAFDYLLHSSVVKMQWSDSTDYKTKKIQKQIEPNIRFNPFININ